MSATFSGPIGGYLTVHSKPPAKETPKPQPEPTPSKQPEVKETPTPKETPKETPTPTPKETPKETPSQEVKAPSQTPKSSSAVPTAIRPPQQTHSESDDGLSKATGSPTRSSPLSSSSPTHLAVDGNRDHAGSATPTVDAASESSTPSSISGAGSGTSAGAKAGIALGVLGGVLVIGLLVFFLVSRRRKQAQKEQLSDDDEKVHGAPPPPVQQRPVSPPVAQPVVQPVSRAISPPLSPELSPSVSPEPIDDMPVRTNPIAPRISLRPVTQFLPNWNLEKQAANAAAVGAAVTGEAKDRPDTSQSNHPANPFGQQAELVPSSNHPANPFGQEAERVPSPVQSVRSSPYIPYSPSVMSMSDNGSNSEVPKAEETAAVPAAVAVAVAAAGVVVAAGTTKLARKASMRNQNPNNVDLTLTTPLPPSPVGSDFSVSSATPGSGAGAAAIAAAGGPANSTVHRVQLDFKPTLEDELGLKAGDLVRLLHEYDDGWVSTPWSRISAFLHYSLYWHLLTSALLGACHPSG